MFSTLKRFVFFVEVADVHLCLKRLQIVIFYEASLFFFFFVGGEVNKITFARKLSSEITKGILKAAQMKGH